MSKKVLLVEDETNIVVSLSFLLERAGYEVATESNGKRAIDLILAQPPDVLILDVMLPEMDGLSILRRIREDENLRTLPVLMLTAKGQREDRRAAIEAGVDVFISKPFSNRELVEAVEQLASRD